MSSSPLPSTLLLGEVPIAVRRLCCVVFLLGLRFVVFCCLCWFGKFFVYSMMSAVDNIALKPINHDHCSSLRPTS